MTKLILADDEPLVLVGLQSMLPWKELGIEICRIVRNGQELEQAIADKSPDLVIADIKMPVKSGLDVLHDCKKRYGRLPLFIMLTSYEEFSLVKQALNYRAVDYLVKLELTKESLSASVGKALDLIGEIKATQAREALVAGNGGLQAFQDKFFVRLFNALIENRSAFEAQSAGLELDFSYPAYVLCHCEIQEADRPKGDDGQVGLYYSTAQMIKETVSRFLHCYATPLDRHHLALTFCLNAEQAPHARTMVDHIMTKTITVIHQYFSVDLLCAVGKEVHDPFALSESFFTARQLLSETSIPHPIAMYDERRARENGKAFDFAEYRKRLTRAFEELDMNELDRIIGEVAKRLNGGTGRIQAIDAASTILYMAISLLPDGQTMVERIFDDDPQDYRGLYKLQTAAQCASWLEKLGKGLKRQLQDRHRDYRARTIANVKHYIKTNLNKHLTLNDVASLFGLSQNYLSTLFSKYGGCSFTEFTTETKVTAAKSLMAEGSYRIYEISGMLGFENSFYFSKVFKKVEGCSPREYIQKLSTDSPRG